MQSITRQSKPTHGWKHTEIKKPEVEASPRETILEVYTSEIFYFLISTQRKSCLQLTETVSKEGRISCNTTLAFPNVKALARNGKHEPQPPWKYRPEHMKITVKEMYITGI